MKIARMCKYNDLPDWVDKDDLSDNGAGKEYSAYIVIEDGEYKKVFSDACESEDKTFYRDFNWIVNEINRLKVGGQ